jgi:DNA-binding transcriptional MerR regulator
MRDDANAMKVGAVAKASGVGVQTLHYYKRVGLLPKPQRSAANYQLFAGCNSLKERRRSV